MKFLEADKEIIKDELNKAYEIGGKIGMWTVYYAYIDTFNHFDSGKAYFYYRHDMEIFVSNLIERFEKREHSYYIKYDYKWQLKEFE